MKLGLYAICKNELKFVNKWFENMFNADYICVLDTGSTDGTYEKLLEYQTQYPDKVIIKQEIIKPWRFDVARNKSLELVPEDADILISTDFDELFTQSNWVDIIKDNWKLGETNRAFYKYAWSHNKTTGAMTDIFMYDKCHTRELHWIFPVHEVLWPIDEKNYVEKPIKLGNVLSLEHFQDDNKPRGYYFDLLKLSVKENPTNAHTKMMLAREYLINKDYQNSLDTYLEVLKMPEIDEKKNRLVLLESLARSADCYHLLNNFDEAIWYADEFIKEDPTYREPYMILGEIYIKMHMYTLAEAIVKAGLEYGTRKYNWIERAPTWEGLPYHLLATCQYYLKKYDEAAENCRIALKYHPNELQVLKNYTEILNSKIKLLEDSNK